MFPNDPGALKHLHLCSVGVLSTAGNMDASPSYDFANGIGCLTLHDDSRLRRQKSRSTLKRKCDDSIDATTLHAAPKRICPSAVRQRRTDLFEVYCNSNKSCIDAFGMERLCSHLNVHPSDTVMLVLAWTMGAQDMCVFTRSEWLTGMSALKCDSLASLEDALPSLERLLKEKSKLRQIYRFAFDFTRDKSQRGIDLESAREMLSCVLGHRFVAWPLLGSFLEFLTKSSYRGMTRDQWNSLFEFADSIAVDLTNYDEESAWPVMLDEFVESQRSTRGLPPYSSVQAADQDSGNEDGEDDGLDMDV